MSATSLPFHARLSGLHSRSESLVELTREYDRNRVPWTKVEEQLRNETIELIRLQEKLGCQPLSDGALGWKDQLRPITQCISGLAEATRYSRWYDTNTFYQKPIVTDCLAVKNFQPDYFLQTNLLPKGGNRSVAIPGPWTLSELSENKYYSSQGELLEDYANALGEIIGRLVSSGVRHVQLSEPSLVYWPYRQTAPSDIELDNALTAIRSVVEKVNVLFTIHTFFGDASPILSKLFELPVDAVGVDLYATDWQSLPQKSAPIGLVLGIVDSEESLAESPEWLVKTARAVHRRIGNDNMSIAPNTDLKFVPRETADRKLAALGRAASILQKEGGDW